MTDKEDDVVVNKKTARKRAYRAANKEKVKAYNKAYCKANKEKKAEYDKTYRAANKEKVSELRARYRALKRGAIPEYLKDCPIEKGRITKTYQLRYLMTKVTGVEHHVDHMWPLSKGGPHWSGNLQVITAKENQTKKGKVCSKTKKTIKEALHSLRNHYE